MSSGADVVELPSMPISIFHVDGTVERGPAGGAVARLAGELLANRPERRSVAVVTFNGHSLTAFTTDEPPPHPRPVERVVYEAADGSRRYREVVDGNVLAAMFTSLAAGDLAAVEAMDGTRFPASSSRTSISCARHFPPGSPGTTTGRSWQCCSMSSVSETWGPWWQN